MRDLAFPDAETEAHTHELNKAQGWGEAEKLAALGTLFPTLPKSELGAVLRRSHGDVEVATDFLFADGNLEHTAASLSARPRSARGEEAEPDSPRRVYIDRCIDQGVAPMPVVIAKQEANLSHINLRGYCLTQKNGHAIGHMLSNLPKSVTSVDLSHNNFGSAAAEIVRALSQNTALVSIDLSHNNLGQRSEPTVDEPHPGSPAVDELVASIYNNSMPYLTTLRLGSNNLGGRNARKIADSMMASDVETLDMCRNQIGVDGGHASGVALGEMVEGTDSLTDVDLSWNSIRGNAADAIGNGLVHNTTMKRLNLAWNSFCDHGAQRVGAALTTNTVIEQIDLSNNRIGEVGALQLASGIKNNGGSFMSLSLNNNSIGVRGGRAIMQTLQTSKNQKLEIHIEGCDLTKGDEKNLDTMFDRAKPNGKYRLDLADPYERSVALELKELAGKHGDATWVDSKLNGKAFTFEAASWQPPGQEEQESTLADIDGVISNEEFRASQQRAKPKATRPHILSLTFMLRQRQRKMSDVIDKSAYDRLTSLLARMSSSGATDQAKQVLDIASKEFFFSAAQVGCATRISL